MRLVPFSAVVAILAVVLVGSLVGTERGWILHDRPVIAHLANLKQPTEIKLSEVLDDYGIHLVRPHTNLDAWLSGFGVGKKGSPDDVGVTTTPALGRSIREIGFFGMPFGWFNDLGEVVYVRNDREMIYAQLNAAGAAAVNKANGRDVLVGNFFPFWAHTWGWLWVAGVGLAIWLWLRAQAKRREELGLIG